MQKKWWKESVVYQIYPRSFCDSNGDGIGDIRGIISRLDYLKELGVDILWLSPVYQSPNDDNGYDISDYQSIMADFGTMEDFEELLEQAHERNIKIIMDLVVNHTSDEHEWFKKSREGDSKYKDYYIWKDGRGELPPTNWGSWFGGPAWQYDEQRKQYYLHIFSKKQPDLNWENEEVREEVFQMMRWWLDKGVDGFRMDVISLISKPESYEDGTPEENGYGNPGQFCIHGPKVHEYLKEMNRKVLSRYDIMTVGEAVGVTLEEARRYAGEESGELNTVFWFEHMDLDRGEYGKWSDKRFALKDLKKVITKWQKGLENQSWNCLFWSNHDQPRAVSRFGDEGEYREKSAKMLATCMHMLQGTPYIYQGEELGMTNAHFTSLEDYRDIESLHMYEEYRNVHQTPHDKVMKYLQNISRDNARTPMQWDDSPNAGFSDNTPWIRVNENYKEINAKAQLEDADSVFYYYQRLIKLRHANECIVYGSYEELMAESDKIFAYRRKWKEEELLVVCNFTKENLAYQLGEDSFGENSEVLICNYENPGFGRLRPYEAVVYRIG